MISFLFLVTCATALLLAVYFGVHRIFPSWGTITMNTLGGFGALVPMVDVLTGLPWEHIVDKRTALAISFALALANNIARLRGPKKSVGAG